MSHVYTADHDPRNPDATPVLDDWGPDLFGDDYWELSDWVTWYSALVAKYGDSDAKITFLSWWQQQGWGAAPMNALTNNYNLRSFFREQGILGDMNPSLIATGDDLFHAAQDAVSGLNKAGSILSWLLPAAVVVYVLGFAAPAAKSLRDVVRSK